MEGGHLEVPIDDVVDGLGGFGDHDVIDGNLPLVTNVKEVDLVKALVEVEGDPFVVQVVWVVVLLKGDEGPVIPSDYAHLHSQGHSVEFPVELQLVLIGQD